MENIDFYNFIMYVHICVCKVVAFIYMCACVHVCLCERRAVDSLGCHLQEQYLST